MEIADLRKFLVIARWENLQKAADELDITPSALSKSLKRLEASLQIALFDRVGKTIRLNAQGVQLQPKAAELVAMAQETRRQLCPDEQHIHCTVAASAILQYRWASVLSRVRPQQNQFTLTFESEFETPALNRLKQGEVQLALVTDAIQDDIPNTVISQPLGKLTMQVAVGRTHPLAKQSTITKEDLLTYPFATPHISPFCGEDRGLGCDGWRDQIMPRKTGWVVNDYAVLSQLVKSGQAIAYLPDFLIREWQLMSLEVSDYPHQYSEQVLLLYHKRAPEWVHELVNDLS